MHQQHKNCFLRENLLGNKPVSDLILFYFSKVPETREQVEICRHRIISILSRFIKSQSCNLQTELLVRRFFYSTFLWILFPPVERSLGVGLRVGRRRGYSCCGWGRRMSVQGNAPARSTVQLNFLPWPHRILLRRSEQWPLWLLNVWARASGLASSPPSARGHQHHLQSIHAHTLPTVKQVLSRAKVKGHLCVYMHFSNLIILSESCCTTRNIIGRFMTQTHWFEFYKLFWSFINIENKLLFWYQCWNSWILVLKYVKRYSALMITGMFFKDGCFLKGLHVTIYVHSPFLIALCCRCVNRL